MKNRIINGLILALGITSVVIAITGLMKSEKAKEDVRFYEQAGIFDLFRDSGRVDFEVVPVKPEIDTYRMWSNYNMHLIFRMPKKDENEYAINLWVRQIDPFNLDRFSQAVLFVIRNGEKESIGFYHNWDPNTNQKIAEVAKKILTQRFTLRKLRKYEDNLLEEEIERYERKEEKLKNERG